MTFNQNRKRAEMMAIYQRESEINDHKSQFDELCFNEQRKKEKSFTQNHFHNENIYCKSRQNALKHVFQ